VCATVADFYRFVHRFFREHIYNQLSKGKRRILHKQMGECLESLYAERSHIAGQLAFHFKEAHDFLKSAQYALMAAQFEQSRYAWAEGEKWSEFGLTILDSLPSDSEMLNLRIDMLEKSGYGYRQYGKFSEAEQRYREVLNYTTKFQINAERKANIYYMLSDICERLGLFHESMEFIEQGKQVLIDYGVPFGGIYLRFDSLWAVMQERFGNNDDALYSLKKILSDVENLPHTNMVDSIKSDAYGRISLILSDFGNYTEALLNDQKSIEIANVSILECDLLDTADIYLRMGDFEQSLVYIEKGWEQAQKTGNLNCIAYARCIKGDVLLCYGKFQEAIDELVESIEIFKQTNSLWYISHPYATLALSHLALSNIATAYQKALRGVEYAEKIPYQIEVGYALDALARVEVAKKDWETATQHFQRAIDIHQKAGHRHFLARTQRHLAEMVLQKGEKQKAIELLQTAMTTFKELNLAHEIEKTQKVLKNAEVLK